MKKIMHTYTVHIPTQSDLLAGDSKMNRVLRFFLYMSGTRLNYKLIFPNVKNFQRVNVCCSARICLIF